jgi:hypothetical protein
MGKEYYTKQYCSVKGCKNIVVVDAGDFLLNLEEKRYCEKHKKNKGENTNGKETTLR